MSSEINDQVASVQTIVLPQVIGAALNSSPSLPPTFGSLCVDPTTLGSMYFGTGTAWKNAGSSNPNSVTGPASSVTGDIVIFTDTTGKAIEDSGMQISTAKFGPFTLTAQTVGFTDITGVTIKMQRLTSSATNINYLTMVINASTSCLTAGNWKSATGIITGSYLPSTQEQFPCMMSSSLIGGSTSQYSYLLIVTVGSCTLVNSYATAGFTLTTGLFTISGSY